MFSESFVKVICRAARLWGVFVASLILAAVMLVATPLQAASYSWTVSSGDWSAAPNWGGTLLPTSSDSAYITNGGTASITSPGQNCSYLFLGGTRSWAATCKCRPVDCPQPNTST